MSPAPGGAPSPAPDDDIEWVACPKCGHKVPDFAGFGFIGRCPSCLYCTHPSSYGGKCGICSEPDEPKPPLAVPSRSAIQQQIGAQEPD